MKTILIQCGYGVCVPLLDEFQHRHTIYCKKHDIDYLCLRGCATRERGLFADRYLLMLSILDHYDLIVYMDTDAIICDFDTDLRDVPIGNAWGGITRWEENGNILAGVQYWKGKQPHLRELFTVLFDVPGSLDEEWFNAGPAFKMIAGGDLTVLPYRWHSNVIHNHPLEADTVIRAVHGFNGHDRLGMLKQELSKFEKLHYEKKHGLS